MRNRGWRHSRVPMAQRYRHKRKTLITRRLGPKLDLCVTCTSFCLLNEKKIKTYSGEPGINILPGT